MLPNDRPRTNFSGGGETLRDVDEAQQGDDGPLTVIVDLLMTAAFLSAIVLLARAILLMVG